MNAQSMIGTKTFLPLLLLTLLASCGGGGGGGSGSTTSSLSGVVMDGYITGATVCLDLNNNGKCDSGEPSTTTGANGSYTFTYPTTSLSNLNVIASVPVGATDSDHPGTTIATAYQLLAPATQPLVVSPLTTLVSQYMAASGVSAQSAASSVVATLSLDSSTNLFSNYLSSSNTANTALHNVAQVVNAVVQNSNLGTTPTKASLNAAVSVAATYVSAATVTNANIGSILSTATVAAAGVTGSLINSAPTPSYTSGNLTLFNQLNAIRQNAGAGAVAQNTTLDTAAANHSNYLINNNLVANAAYLATAVSGVSPTILGGHYEDSSRSGFTGSTPLARTMAAGYLGASVNELISFGSANVTDCSASIENSVYHLIQLISPFYEVGLSYNAPTGSGSVCDIELGVSTASGQYPPSGSWVFYPANGQTGVAPTFYNQAESPVPAADLPLAGHPIVMSLYNQTNKSLLGSDIVVNSFSLTGASAVASRVLAQSGVGASDITLTVDTNISAPGILVLLPTSPLTPNTSYTVNFSATVKGISVAKTWLFTTGSAN
jgi:uncharacterized protein YkwD